MWSLWQCYRNINFHYTATQNTYKANHQFNCSKKFFVYLLKCNKCFKKHVGQTVDEFRRRWNNYKSVDRLKSCMQEHLFSHFSLAGHDGFFNDVSITFIDKTDPSDPSRREDYWRQTLKQWFRSGLILKTVSDRCFCVSFLYGNVSFLHSSVSIF